MHADEVPLQLQLKRAREDVGESSSSASPERKRRKISGEEGGGDRHVQRTGAKPVTAVMQGEMKEYEQHVRGIVGFVFFFLCGCNLTVEL